MANLCCCRPNEFARRPFAAVEWSASDRRSAGMVREMPPAKRSPNPPHSSMFRPGSKEYYYDELGIHAAGYPAPPNLRVPSRKSPLPKALQFVVRITNYGESR